MFPATGKTTLSTAWSRVTSTAANIKQEASVMIAAGSIARRVVLEYANALADALATLDALAATPGLAVYAQNELNDPSINIATEFTSMRAQIVATQDWIVANFPKDGSNNLVVYSFDANKRFADVPLTAPQLTAFKAQLSSLAATIN